MTSCDQGNLIDDDIKAYIAAIPSLSANYAGVNPFWDDILKDFKSRLPNQNLRAPTESDVASIIAKLNSAPKTGYLLESLNKNTPVSKDHHYQAANRLRKRLKKIPWKLAYQLGLQNRTFKKQVYEHAIGLAYLKSNGLVDSYLNYLNSLKLRSNYLTTRYYAYLGIIESLLAKHHQNAEDLSVLEIGSGSANFALFLMNRLNVNQYFFVDLPEMILLAIHSMKKYYPQKKFCILDSSAKRDAVSNADLIFVPAQFIEQIPDACVRMAVNMHSFQEMDKNIRDEYFVQVYRILKPHALFFNVNWFQANMTNLDGGTYDNNPLQYPYSKDSRPLMWEEDPFHGFLRRKFNYKNSKSLSTIYAGLVG